MTDTEADGIYGHLVNALANCDSCGDAENVLSLRASADGDLVCTECDETAGSNSPTVEALIQAETDVKRLRRALIGAAGS